MIKFKIKPEDSENLTEAELVIGDAGNLWLRIGGYDVLCITSEGYLRRIKLSDNTILETLLKTKHNKICESNAYDTTH